MTPKYPQTVTIETRDGAAEAVKPDQDRPWDISYPWGAARYHGAAAAVKREMMRATEQHYYPHRDGPRERVTERMFPMLHGAPTVPWRVMAPHEAQAKANHGQSLEELARRHGLDSTEAWCVVSGQGWAAVPIEEGKAKWREFAASMVPTEHIIGVAIRANGAVVFLAAPARHNHVIEAIVEAGIADWRENQLQGFVTSEGKFVNRERAAAIAYAAGQCGKKRGLTSEDVW